MPIIRNKKLERFGFPSLAISFFFLGDFVSLSLEIIVQLFFLSNYKMHYKNVKAKLLSLDADTDFHIVAGVLQKIQYCHIYL